MLELWYSFLSICFCAPVFISFCSPEVRYWNKWILAFLNIHCCVHGTDKTIFLRQKLIHMNNLTANHTCASHDFSCANGKECIAIEWRCDRDYDCGDMSDEHDCEPGKVKSIHLPLGCCASCWEKLRFFLIFLSNNDFYISFFSCVMEALPL